MSDIEQRIRNGLDTLMADFSRLVDDHEDTVNELEGKLRAATTTPSVDTGYLLKVLACDHTNHRACTLGGSTMAGARAEFAALRLAASKWRALRNIADTAVTQPDLQDAIEAAERSVK